MSLFRFCRRIRVKRKIGVYLNTGKAHLSMGHESGGLHAWTSLCNLQAAPSSACLPAIIFCCYSFGRDCESCKFLSFLHLGHCVSFLELYEALSSSKSRCLASKDNTTQQHCSNWQPGLWVYTTYCFLLTHPLPASVILLSLKCSVHSASIIGSYSFFNTYFVLLVFLQHLGSTYTKYLPECITSSVFTHLYSQPARVRRTDYLIYFLSHYLAHQWWKVNVK